MLRKAIGSITIELWFEMFGFLINLKKVDLNKRPTDYNPNAFWILTVQDWAKTSPANAVRPFNENLIFRMLQMWIKKGCF